MSDLPEDRGPALTAPLKVMAVSAVAAILGFGLCTANMMKNSNLANAGAVACCAALLIFVVSAIWFICATSLRVMRRGRSKRRA
jgi:drug/metabolite transporter (DMT)-like permease